MYIVFGFLEQTDDTKLALLSQKWPSWGPILLELTIIRGLTISQYSKNGKNSTIIKSWLLTSRKAEMQTSSEALLQDFFILQKVKNNINFSICNKLLYGIPKLYFFSNFRPICNLCLLQSVYNQGINDPDCQKFTLIKLNQCHCHVNQNSKQIWST